ncbi:MAG: alpha/beta hydrolase, partial [Rhizomicrobium sp.]
MVFLDYDQAGLDRQYDQRAWAPNAVDVIRRYTENSAQVRARLGEPDVFAYGQSAAETLDLYRCPNDNAPIHVFIHGGAWRQLGKRDSAFAAETFVRAGAHFIAPDFALLPSVTLAGMVAQVRRSVAWIHQNAARFGGDPARLHISGHSSGGHLAGCVAVTDWQEFGLPGDVVKSAVLASGIYNLLPVRLSARNDYVRLDASTEQALSPIRHLRHFTGKAYVACGALESDEFKRQARALAAALDPLQLAVP